MSKNLGTLNNPSRDVPLKQSVSQPQQQIIDSPDVAA